MRGMQRTEDKGPKPVESGEEAMAGQDRVLSLILRVSTRLGAIAAPPPLVGLTCQLLGLPTQTTAVISLAAVAVSVAVACTYYLTYESSVAKKTGLAGYYNRSNDFLTTELTQRLRNTKEEVIFFGPSFQISAADARNELLSRLVEGVKIRYLIVDPFSAAIEEIAKDFNISTSEMRSIGISSLRSILLLKKEWTEVEGYTETPGELQVRVFSARPTTRVYVFDGKRVSSESYIVPYINRVNAPDSPGYIFKNKSDGAFSKYYASITQIWRDAETLEELLRRHPEVLKE